jgi:hypothetical protein
MLSFLILFECAINNILNYVLLNFCFSNKENFQEYFLSFTALKHLKVAILQKNEIIDRLANIFCKLNITNKISCYEDNKKIVRIISILFI